MEAETKVKKPHFNEEELCTLNFHLIDGNKTARLKKLVDFTIDQLFVCLLSNEFIQEQDKETIELYLDQYRAYRDLYELSLKEEVKNES